MKNHYKILGLETTATLKEIEKIFNVLYKEYDPEKEEYEDYPYLLKIINQKLNNQKNLEFGC